MKFLRTIIEAAPHPLEMADISRDLVTSTAGPDYYLVNMGKDVKGFWTFNLPLIRFTRLLRTDSLSELQ